MPPMDDSIGMEEPNMGGEMDSTPPMGEDPTMVADQSIGDDGSMDDMPQQGQDQDDDEIMNIINSLSIEDKAAVEKYAKSMVDDDSSDNSSNDNMPMESRYRSIKSVIDETISSYLYDDDDDEEERMQKLPKEYKGFNSPFKSPYE